jgi:hypothetical protein
MNSGVLALTFDETVDPATLLVTQLTLQDALTAIHTFALAAQSVVGAGLSTVVTVTLTTGDVDTLKSSRVFFATAQSNSCLTFVSGAIKGTTNNDVFAVVDGAAKQTSQFTQDSTLPTLVSLTMDLNAGTATLTYSETVDASSLVPASLSLHDAVPATTSYTLTGGAVNGASFTSVVRTFSTTDLNEIKAIQALTTTYTTVYLSFSVGSIQDMHYNKRAALTAVNTKQVT